MIEKIHEKNSSENSEILELEDEIYNLENDIKNGRFSERKSYEDELKTHLKDLKEELKFLKKARDEQTKNVTKIHDNKMQSGAPKKI